MARKGSPKRKRVTEEEVHEMMRMRRQGQSMKAIAQAIGCHRQTVRMHLKERRGDILADEVRKQLLIDELRRHLDELTRFAALVNFPMPASPHETRDAAAVLDSLLHKDFRRGLDSGPQTAKRKHEQNKMLFRALREHTRGVLAFEEWEQAWDNCIWALGGLQSEACQVIKGILDKERDLLNRIEEGTGKKDAMGRMVHGVLHMVWQQILKPDQEFPLVQTMPRSDGRTEVLFGKDKKDEYLIFAEMDLAAEVVRVCKCAAQNFRGDIIEAVAKEVNTMQGRIEKFQKVLNPLILRPLLLRTRCDLCPA